MFTVNQFVVGIKPLWLNLSALVNICFIYNITTIMGTLYPSSNTLHTWTHTNTTVHEQNTVRDDFLYIGIIFHDHDWTNTNYKHRVNGVCVCTHITHIMIFVNLKHLRKIHKLITSNAKI